VEQPRYHTAVLLLSCCIFFPTFAWSQHGGGSHGGGSSHGGSHAGSTSSGTVQVHGYTRAGGTYVRSYTRSSPGGATKEIDLSTTAPYSGLGSISDGTLGSIQRRRTAPTISPNTPTAKPPFAPPTLKSVSVMADPQSMRYYRTDCSTPATARKMTRSTAIAGGFRPDPGCFARAK
jgi:hypothetical protein